MPETDERRKEYKPQFVRQTVAMNFDEIENKAWSRGDFSVHKYVILASKMIIVEEKLISFFKKYCANATFDFVENYI